MGPASDKLLTDQLRLMADHFPGECAYGDVDTGRQMTFKEWDRDSDRVAGALTEAGVVKGDRVAIYLPPE
jgi:acyl-coenzyme A synthetase/AMP-(fatty) acid ligase